MVRLIHLLKAKQREEMAQVRRMLSDLGEVEDEPTERVIEPRPAGELLCLRAFPYGMRDAGGDTEGR